MSNDDLLTYDNITPIGRVNFRQDNRIFGIKDKDRLNHIYSIGKSGTGKSTLLLNMAISDINRGHGIAVIDPHGDVAEELLNYIPYDRLDDVIYFTPADFPIPYNPLKNVHFEFQHLVASGLLSTFEKLYSDFWGPRMAHILRYTLLTLLEYRDATLLDIAPLLTDYSFREHVLTRITSEHILQFWRNEFEQYSKTLRAEAIAPILNKVGLFSSSIPLRNVIGQKTRGFNMENIMNEGKILICNLSKGKLGEDTSTLLGSILLTSIQLAALSRANQTEHTRRPFYAYIDEMHNYVTLSIADILSECRKYGLSLFLTNQYLDQLKPDIRSAIFGNVGTLISFRVGNEDAEYLSKEFHPVFTDIDLINLPRYTMYLKLMIDGTISQPFSAFSLPIIPNKNTFRNDMIKLSKTKFSPKRMEGNQENISTKDIGQLNLFD